MLNALELDDVAGKNAIGIECEVYALTWTMTHKGGWVVWPHMKFTPFELLGNTSRPR